MSFASLKKQSSLGNLTAKLIKEVEKSNSPNQADDRLWKPEVDKAGNGYAVIRFLPAPDKEEVPFVKLYNHAFQGPGGWYIENSRTTIGGKDPCSEFNTGLWNSGIESDKQIARNQKRKLSYYSNIYVVKDPANPENEGKVFLYKYGRKIYDKIISAMQPEFEDEQSVDAFDLWKGADFKIKIKKVAGFWNYDSSEFAKPTPFLKGDDDALEAVWKKEYSLQEIISEDKFKSYDDLKKRLEQVLKLNATPARKVAEEVVDEEVETVSSSEDTDDALSYFQKLAEE